MRIIGGEARGRRLAVPPERTRPTSERAREGLFNTLASEVDLSEVRFLDLFAGSGAVGLEALSRGAEAVVLVESDRGAAAVIDGNIAAVGIPGATVRRITAEAYLAAAGLEGPFDVVFADPPYDLDGSAVTAMLSALTDERLLVEDGLVVVERSARDPEPDWPPEFTGWKERRYGEARLWYGRRD
jgi:16S rRNA (guanine966-N2)-methyltransferase